MTWPKRLCCALNWIDDQCAPYCLPMAHAFRAYALAFDLLHRADAKHAEKNVKGSARFTSALKTTLMIRLSEILALMGDCASAEVVKPGMRGALVP